MDDLGNGCTTHHAACACGEARHAAEVAALRSALEEREADMHRRIRAGYDKTVADCWRARLAEVEAELDAVRIELDAARSASASLREQLARLAGAVLRGTDPLAGPGALGGPR